MAAKAAIFIYMRNWKHELLALAIVLVVAACAVLLVLFAEGAFI